VRNTTCIHYTSNTQGSRSWLQGNLKHFLAALEPVLTLATMACRLRQKCNGNSYVLMECRSSLPLSCCCYVDFILCSIGNSFDFACRRHLMLSNTVVLFSQSSILEKTLKSLLTVRKSPVKTKIRILVSKILSLYKSGNNG
jgi:hypothetical protein